MKFFYRCDFNRYTINYLLRIGKLKSAEHTAIEITEKSDKSDESDSSFAEEIETS